MSTSSPLAYQMPQTRDAWWLLRVAVILWASMVLLRHATYWGGQLMDGLPYRSGSERFPFAEIEVASEVVVLLASLGVAALTRRESIAAAHALRWLAIAYIVLVAADLAMGNSSTIFTPHMSAREIVRAIWQVVSRLQLLVVPALCITYATAKPRPPATAM